MVVRLGCDCPFFVVRQAHHEELGRRRSSGLGTGAAAAFV